MSKTEFKLSITLPATAEQIFDAWLSTRGHGEMTGSPAKVEGRIGGKFSAWDGYIWGETLEMERPRRILQSWRTTEFAEGDPDSMVEILLEEARAGTRLSLRHWNIPAGQSENYKQGWEDFYFTPMREFFGD